MNKDRSIIIEETENGFVLTTFEQLDTEDEPVVTHQEVKEVIEDSGEVLERRRHPQETIKRVLEQ